MGVASLFDGEYVYGGFVLTLEKQCLLAHAVPVSHDRTSHVSDSRPVYPEASRLDRCDGTSAGQ